MAQEKFPKTKRRLDQRVMSMRAAAARKMAAKAHKAQTRIANWLNAGGGQVAS